MFADDPYYCGMKARVPNFAKSKVKENKGPPPVISRYMGSISNGHLASAHTSHHGSVMWHARSYDSGMGKKKSFVFEIVLWWNTRRKSSNEVLLL